MSESNQMPEKTRRNYFRALQDMAIKAKDRVVKAAKNLGAKCKHGWKAFLRGSKKAAAGILHGATRTLKFIGQILLAAARVVVLGINMILLWISLAVMIVINAVYKLVLAVSLALMTPHVLAGGGKDAVKTDWSLYFAGWKPRNYFTLTLGEVARAEDLREAQVFMDGEEDDSPRVYPDQQPKGRPTPRQRRPHPRRVKPQAVRTKGDAGSPAAAPA